tara:strand:+ start:334 stop:462 length:129 start_codon:yes stop_codon:yes gene_type:complete
MEQRSGKMDTLEEQQKRNAKLIRQKKVQNRDSVIDELCNILT